MQYKFFVVLLFFCLVCSMVFSSISENDKLLDQLRDAEGIERISVLKELSQYYAGSDPKKSLKYADEALNISKTLKNEREEADVLNTIAANYYHQQNYKKAIKFYTKEYEILVRLKNNHGVFESLFNIAASYSALNNYRKAASYYQQSLEIAEEIALQDMISNNLKVLADVLEKQKNYEEALKYYKKYNEIIYSKFSEDSEKEISILESKYEQEKIENLEKEIKLKKAKQVETELKKTTEKKSKEITKLNIKNEENEAEIAAQQRILIFAVSIAILVIIILFFIYNQFKIKKKNNIILEQRNAEILLQKEEIVSQKDEIQRQKDIVDEHRKEMIDSIKYASRIQNAMLPMQIFLNEVFTEHFIFYQPRDVVSGDFYWVTRKQNQTIIAVADCTGHGVPGAFMSMLGVASLREIINKDLAIHAQDVLELLRDTIIRSLHQTGKLGGSKDGMDMAMCIISDNLELEYAGANSPVYIIRNKELMEIKPDKMPIGIYPVEGKKFTLHKRMLQKDDCVYFFSDGYADQFGGPQGKKFKYKNFKELLLENSTKPMPEQERLLNETFEEWKGDYNQVDDVLVMGIKI